MMTTAQVKEDTDFGSVTNNGPSGSEAGFVRGSTLRSTAELRKARGKISDYFSGLKKKMIRDRNPPTTGTAPSSDKTFTLDYGSRSNFYCSSSNNAGADDTSSSSAQVHTATSDRGDATLDESFVKEMFKADYESLESTTGPLNTISVIDDDEMADDDDLPSPVFYILTVHLKSGGNLVIKDKTGSSDPFVKVKVGEKTLYKSRVIYTNLNPIWDEHFTIPIHNIKEPIVFKVVDYDWGSKDDFMGMCVIDLRKVPITGELVDVKLNLSKTGVIGEKSMGELFVSVMMSPRTPEEKQIWMFESTTTQAQIKKQKHTWNGTLSVFFIGASDLPLRRNSHPTMADTGASAVPIGYSNVFAKLKFGNQKRRTKHVTEVTDTPQWLEQFDFYLLEGNGHSTILEIDVFEEAPAGRITLGSAVMEIGQLEQDKTMEYFLNFMNGLGRVRLVITVTGFRPNQIDTVSYSSRESTMAKYSLGNTLKLNDIRDVGHLTVKVIQAEGLRAADFGGKSDPYCVVELVNERVQTFTDYKTLEPAWNKTFHFQVRDITSKLEVTVYDEDRDHKYDFLGKIIIPLWNIQNGEEIWYKLKNRSLAKGARGNNPQILLQMDLFWNPIRAAIRVTEPQEIKYSQTKPQLKIETFLINMERFRRVLMEFYDIWLYIKSCLEWKYPERSIKALTIYLLTCYFFQPFFVPLFLLIFWLRPWWRNTSYRHEPAIPMPRTSKEQTRESPCRNTMKTIAGDTLNLDESDDEEDITKLTLIEKFGILQDASGVLQELVGEVAGICESTVNTYRMVVPFIYWLFILLFAIATVIFLLIDFRYVAMLFGIHEFSRVYLRPWKQSYFELYHMIRRVPHSMNLGDKLGLNSVLKSIQQLKTCSANKQKFYRKQKSPSPSSPFSSGTETKTSAGTSWYVEQG